MEKFLSYYVNHLDAIIQWIVALILGVSAFLLYRAITGRGDKASHQQTQDLEATLKRVLGSIDTSAPTAANTKAGVAGDVGRAPVAAITGVGVTAASGAAPSAASEEVKSQLQAREKEIKELKENVTKQVSEATQGQLHKIKELEARLAEYAIIEDDIADLSRFRDENQKLQQELAALKGDAAPAAAAPESAPAPAPETAAAASVPASEAPTIETAPVAAPAVEAAPKVEVAAPAAPPAPVPAAAAPAAPAAPAPKLKNDDILAEFAGSGDDLNTDKMLSEIAGFENAAATGSTGLDEAMDVEKMASEATELAPPKG